MRHQNGVTLIEMIFLIGLASIMTMLAFYEKQADLEQARARQVGGYLYQYNNALRNALAKGELSSSTTRSGTDWLKNITCGGGHPVGSEFLPCDFPSATTSDPIKFGQISLSTSVLITGNAPNTRVIATTMTTPFTLVSSLGVHKIRADLAGVATLSAAAAMSSGYNIGSTGGLSPYSAATDSSYKSDPLSAKITFVASNTANNDVWLRTDGGNQMHASLAFDSLDSANRMITGASSVQNIAGQALRLGNGSSLTPVTNSSVVIDSNAEILGDFRIRRTLTVDNSVSVTGDITASGSVRANNDLVAGRNVTAGGSITATGNVSANGALVGQIFYDSNNSGYYVDPSNLSNISSLSANNISTSGRIKTAEFVEIGGVANSGAACAPNGLLGRDSSGVSLSCTDGQWKTAGISLVIYQCPNTQLTASGPWASFGCIGQLSSIPQCENYTYFNKSTRFPCDRVN